MYPFKVGDKIIHHAGRRGEARPATVLEVGDDKSPPPSKRKYPGFWMRVLFTKDSEEGTFWDYFGLLSRRFKLVEQEQPSAWLDKYEVE